MDGRLLYKHSSQTEKCKNVMYDSSKYRQHRTNTGQKRPVIIYNKISL